MKGTHARSGSHGHCAAVSPTLKPQAHREPLAHPRRPGPIAAQEAHVLRAREAHQPAPGHLEHRPLPGQPGHGEAGQVIDQVIKPKTGFSILIEVQIVFIHR